MFVLMVLMLRWKFGTILSYLRLFLTVHSSVSMKLVMVSISFDVRLGGGLVVRFIVSTTFS